MPLSEGFATGRWGKVAQRSSCTVCLGHRTAELPCHHNPLMFPTQYGRTVCAGDLFPGTTHVSKTLFWRHHWVTSLQSATATGSFCRVHSPCKVQVGAKGCPSAPMFYGGIRDVTSKQPDGCFEATRRGLGMPWLRDTQIAQTDNPAEVGSSEHHTGMCPFGVGQAASTHQCLQ